MYPLILIEAVLENMRREQAQVNELQGKLADEVGRIDNTQGLDADFREKKIKEIRAARTPAIYEKLGRINKEAGRLEKEALPFWKDIKFVLSKKLLTPAHRDNTTLPADPDKESVVRMQKLGEFSKMNDSGLHMAASSSIEEAERNTFGERDSKYAELYLIDLENDSRKGKAGWQPIDLDRVKIPQRDTALKLINEAQRMASTIHMQMQTAEGRKITPAEKITAARVGI